MNKLFITDNSIEFLGFELLEQHVTFCLYSGGIVIQPNWREEKRPYCYEGVLNNERKINDKLLIDVLRERGLSDEETFVCANNNHYIELVPHKEQSLR